MNQQQREYALNFLVCQTKGIDQIEGLLETLDADCVATRELVKIQREIVSLQNRFNRLVYLSGEVVGE